MEVKFNFINNPYYIKNNKKNFINKKMLIDLSNNSLVSIASHSKSHPLLSKCNDKDLNSEIKDSKSYLEDLLGKEITQFSYPNGDYNLRVKDKIAQSGYKLAFCSNFNMNLSSENKFSLSRTEIWNSDSLKTFKEKLNGDWDWLKYRGYNFY